MLSLINKPKISKQCNEGVTRWIGKVLSSKTAESKIGKQTIEIRNSRGTSQDDVCLSLMSSLVVDDLLNRVAAFGVHCIAYVNDIVIKAKFKLRIALKLIMNGVDP